MKRITFILSIIMLSGFSLGQMCSMMDEDMCDMMMMCEWDADAGECVPSGEGGGCSWGNWDCEQDSTDGSWDCEGSGPNCYCEEDEDGDWNCEGMGDFGCEEDEDGNWDCEGMGECDTDEDGYWSCESFDWGFGNCGFDPDSVAWGWGDWNWEEGGYQSSDINADFEINILDVVNLVNFILIVSEPNDYEYWASDLNEDGLLNILDVVGLVNQILNGRADFEIPLAKINKNKVILSGSIGGIQFNGDLLSSLHGNDIIASANGITLIYNLSGNLDTPELNLSENYSNLIISSSTGEVVRAVKIQSFGINNCYPNPFNPSTTITVNLIADSHINISVYNILGQQVAELVDAEFIAGEYNVTWNASNQPSGLYLVKMATPNQTEVQRVTLMK